MGTVQILSLFLLVTGALAVNQTLGPVSQTEKSNSLFRNSNITLRTENTLCKNAVPGLLRMSQGVDIAALDLFPLDVSAPNGFRRTIFEYTCNVDRPWRDPMDSEAVYEIPDQVESVIPVPSGSLNIKTQVNEQMQQYKDSMAAKVELSMDAGLFGSFSASSSYKDSQEKLLKTQKSLTETTSAESAFQVYYKHPIDLKLSQNFRRTLDQLPEKYSGNPAGYNTFVRDFGTHYFEMAKFGGFLFEKNELSSHYMETTSERELNLNLAASFKFFVKVDNSVEIGQITSEQRTEFLSNSELSFYYYGGDGKRTTSPVQDGDLDKWRSTVSKNPWLFAGAVKPISDLVENSAKQMAVKTAVIVHLAQVYLGDARNAYSISGISMSSAVKNKLAEIERKLSNSSISTSELEQLNQDIARILTDLQALVDQNNSNKLDLGDHFERFYLHARGDKSCQCDANPGASFDNCFIQNPIIPIRYPYVCKEYQFTFQTSFGMKNSLIVSGPAIWSTRAANSTTPTPPGEGNATNSSVN